MKIPLDHICVKSGVLCPRCQGLVASGAVEDHEVNVMRALLELEGTPEFKFLRNSIYHRAIKLGDFLAILLQLADSVSNPRLINRLDRHLSDALGMRVRVIDRSSGNIKHIVSQLIMPARVSGINTLWLPDGSTQYIVRIPRSDSRYLPASREVIEEVLSNLIGSGVRIRAE